MHLCKSPGEEWATLGEAESLPLLNKDFLKSSNCGGMDSSAPKGCSELEILPPVFVDCRRSIAISGHGLPHWEQRNAVCFVTWRTADSLPQGKLAELSAEQESWRRAHPDFRLESGTAESLPLQKEYRELFCGRMQKWLDAGMGACALRDAIRRQAVEKTIMHFQGERYFVYAFVVMPNHVHVLFMPLHDNRIRDIVTSWKRFSAKRVNELVGESGAFWQKESWDYLVRDEIQLRKFVRYIMNNNPSIAWNAWGLSEL